MAFFGSKGPKVSMKIFPLTSLVPQSVFGHYLYTEREAAQRLSSPDTDPLGHSTDYLSPFRCGDLLALSKSLIFQFVQVPHELLSATFPQAVVEWPERVSVKLRELRFGSFHHLHYALVHETMPEHHHLASLWLD